MSKRFSLIDIKDPILNRSKFLSVRLDYHTTSEAGEITLTEQLATKEEVDHAIDTLISNLESLRIQAKSKLCKKGS